MKLSTLTENQQEILEIIYSHIQINGEAPSLRDIAKKTSKVKSLRGIALQLNALVDAGYITRSSEAKSIEVNEVFSSGNDKIIRIPLFTGTVQAGFPSEFNEYSDDTIPVSLSMTKGLRSVFAIKVRGLSMIGAGIDDGDYAIVSEMVNASSGDIVLASTSEGLTLKTYRIIDGHHMLFPANKDFKPLVDGFEIRGKLVSLLKPAMLQYFQQRASFV